MAVSSSEPSFMSPVQPSCLLRHNTLHWSLTVYFHIKIVFEEPSGKGKKYAQVGCLSNKNIFSVPCNTQKNVVFTGNHCLLVYMHPRSIPENTYKGFKGSQQDTSGGVLCQRDASKGAGDAEFFLVCIRPLRTSVDPAEHSFWYFRLLIWVLQQLFLKRSTICSCEITGYKFPCFIF